MNAAAAIDHGGQMPFGANLNPAVAAHSHGFANAAVLPAGWELTNSTIPGTISRLPDGRVRLDFLNPRPDEIDVLITARKAKSP